MKKLMMFAAAVTITGGAFAQCSPITPSSPCETPVWDLKASGKMANPWTELVSTPAKMIDLWDSKGYKSVQALSLQGALVGIMTENTNTAACCLSGFDVYIYNKSTKTLLLFESQDVEKLTVFGKNLDTVLKAGHSTTVESDIFWTIDEWFADLQFVGFGKGKRYMSKGTEGSSDACNPVTAECPEESFGWPEWNGWFTGWLDPDDQYLDLNCQGPCEAVAGGTWSAKYNRKLSAAEDVEDAIMAKFRVSSIWNRKG